MQENKPEGEAKEWGLSSFERRLIRIWGGAFRALFITAIGFGGYLLIDPPAIADQPLAGLTIRDIARNIFAYGLAFGCISWFFHFPNESSFDNVLTYEDWGKFGGWVILGTIMVAWFIFGNR